MGDYNSNVGAGVLGSEWRPQSSRNIVVSGANALVQRFRPGAVTPAKLDAYLAAVLSAGLCMEIVDTLTPALDAAVTVFPANNTGAVTTGWVDEGSVSAPVFSKVNKSGDDSTYAQHFVVAGSTLQPMTFRCATAIAAGKRIVSVQAHVRGYAYTGSGAGFDLSLGGTDLQTPIALTTDFIPRTLDGTIYYLHPTTGIPWSLTAQANVLCNGTDRIGVYAALNTYVRVSGVWLTVVTCVENRRAFNYQAAGSGPGVGWSQKTLVGPNGAAIGALSANTWYYIVLWAPGGASFTVPALKDANVVMATVASSTTAEHRQTYNATVGGSGVLSAAAAVPKEIAPVLIEAPAGTFNSQSHPYGALSPVTVDSSVTPGVSQQITSPGVTTYAQVKLSLGWVGARPDGPLTVEVRHGGGAATGGGVLDATGSVATTDLASGTMADFTVNLAASFASSATQFFVFFRSSASAGKGWKLGRVDVVDTTVSGVTTAQVEGTGIGAATDSYVDTGGTARSRYDIPVLLIAGVGGGGGAATPPGPPATFTVTPRVAA